MRRQTTRVKILWMGKLTEVAAYATASPYLAVTYAYPDHKANPGLDDIKRVCRITHVPTGYAVTSSLPTVTAAQHLAAIIAQLPVPWESANPGAITAACKALPEPVRRWFISAINT